MNKFTRKAVLLAVAVFTILAVVGTTPVIAAQTTITWFVGLGAGTKPEDLKPQQDVVDKFNAAHPDIDLKLTVAASNQVAGDTFTTLVASGTNVPDVVGPLGVEGTTFYHDSWLDIAPLVAKTKYDLKQFSDSQVKVNQEGDKLYGIPFGVYPGVMFYNKDLFDAAGLAYPPSKFDEKYKLDGKDVDWSWDTAYTIAKKLTFDKAGKDATDPAFDPTNIVQFGLDQQWDTERSDMQTYGGAPVIDAKTGKVLITANWRAEAQDMFKAIWVDHSMPNQTYENSDLLKPSAFASGKVAMGRVMLWYTCCLADLKAKWDIGVQPSYKGVYTPPSDVDTFRIYKGTKSPDAAFTVLSYLTNEAALDLLTHYGSVPARPELQSKFIEGLSKAYPSVTNWSIIGPSLDHAAVPHHQSSYPNYARGQQRFSDFNTWLRSAGPTAKPADVDTQLDKLQADIQTLVDNPTKALATAAPTAAK